MKAERKPSLSPSKISTFLACPIKYYHTYLNPSAKWFLRSKSYYSFGQTLHKVLERFYDVSDTGVTTDAEAVTAVEENWLSAGFDSQESMTEAQCEGKAIITEYLEAVREEEQTKTTLGVEIALKMEFGEFFLVGRIDRLAEGEDGTVEIIDYKSHRGPTTEEAIKSDLALSCYQLLVRHHYPGRRVVASLHALSANERATAGLNEDELEAFTDDLQTVGRLIVGKNWEEVVPVKKPICERCDFLLLCKRDPRYDQPE